MVRAVELTSDDAADLAALYADHDWWADRDEPQVAAAVEGSDLVLGLRADASHRGEDETRTDELGDLVAAARVLTDGAYYATAYDVIVAADRRGEGFGKRLMRAVVAHDALGDAPRVSLACREGLREFYADCGFESAQGTVEHDGQTEPLVRMVYHR